MRCTGTYRAGYIQDATMRADEVALGRMKIAFTKLILRLLIGFSRVEGRGNGTEYCTKHEVLKLTKYYV